MAPNEPVARSAPDFLLKDPAGRDHSLKELTGKPVVLHFWAAWCPPCLEEIPNWVALAQHYQGKPLGFIAVSLDAKWADALKVLPVDKTPANVTSLIDLSGKLSEDYGTYQFPETYLLNAKHEIVHKWVGGQNWSNPEILKALDQISGGAAK